MSVDEVMKFVERVSHYDPARPQDLSRLRIAIKKHVEEAVAKEREGCAKMADEYATWGGSNFYDWFKKLATAIRARAEKETK